MLWFSLLARRVSRGSFLHGFFPRTAVMSHGRTEGAAEAGGTALKAPTRSAPFSRPSALARTRPRNSSRPSDSAFLDNGSGPTVISRAAIKSRLRSATISDTVPSEMKWKPLRDPCFRPFYPSGHRLGALVVSGGLLAMRHFRLRARDKGPITPDSSVVTVRAGKAALDESPAALPARTTNLSMRTQDRPSVDLLALPQPRNEWRLLNLG